MEDRHNLSITSDDNSTVVSPKITNPPASVVVIDEEKDASSYTYFEKQPVVQENGRYGVQYGFRYFVTKIGFLRSVKRLFCVSGNGNVQFIDPYTNEVKESYTFDQIIDISSDSTDDKGFSVTTALKSSKEHYSCRYRPQLLSAWHQLKHRWSEKQESTLPSLNAGPYYVEKLSLSQQRGDSSSNNIIRVKRTLVIRAASLDREDNQCRDILSSIPLREIVKLEKVVQEENGLLIYFDHNRIHRYWFNKPTEREPFIQALKNNLALLQGSTLTVEETSDCGSFEAYVASRDIPQPVSFEVPVTRFGKSGKLKERLVGLTQSAIIESDAVTKRLLNSFSFSDIYNIVLFPEKPGKFAIELKLGRTRLYECKTSSVSRRDDDVSIGFSYVSEEDNRKFKAAINARKNVDSRFYVAGGTDIMSPEGVLSVLMSNILELAEMNNVYISWSSTLTPVGCKEGTWNTTVHADLEDIFLKKVSTLSIQKSSESEIKKTLVEFNANISVCGLKQRERRAFTALMKILESNDCTDNYSLMIPVLLCIQRLLCTRAVFDEVPSSSYRKSLSAIIDIISSEEESPLKSFAASLVLKYMVINKTESKSTKVEAVNRKAVFTASHNEKLVHASLFRFDIPERSLVTWCLLKAFEVVLASGKKGTAEKVLVDLLTAMKVPDFESRQALFRQCRSSAFGITKCASILLKVHVLEQTSEVVEMLQNHARNEGLLIWQLYLALSSVAKSQRRNSSQLVALLTHENSPSSAVIRKIFPPALIGDIPTCNITYDEYGEVIHGGDYAFISLSPVKDSPLKRKASASDSISLSRSARRVSSTRTKAVGQTKCVVLLPEFFERINKNHVEKDLNWNSLAVKELCNELQRQLALLDLERLRHAQYMAADPLASFEIEENLSDNVLLPISSSAAAGVDELSSDAAVLSPMKEESSNNQLFRSFSGTTQVLSPTAASESLSHPDRSKFNLQNAIDKILDNSNNILETSEDDEEGLVVWNHEEFEMSYRCFEDEVRVGPYYLSNILNDRGNLCEEIERPEDFLTSLYYRVLQETSVEHQGVQLLCLKVMTLVYDRYQNEIHSLRFINHLIEVSMSNNELQREWPLVVRGAVMLFISNCLKGAANVKRFLKRRENISTIMNLLREVSPMVLEEATTTFKDVRQQQQPDVGGGGFGNSDEEDRESEISPFSDDGSGHYKFSYSPEGGMRRTMRQASNATNSSEVITVVDTAWDMSATGISLICLEILMNCVRCHASEDTISGSLFCPIPAVKSSICTDYQVLSVLVQLLGYPDESTLRIFKATLELVSSLIYRHEAIIPTLYRTGLFYLLLRYGSTDAVVMKQVAEVLEPIHLRQDITLSPSQCASSPDPLTQICLQSILVNLLPPSMIAQLVRHGPEKFAEMLCSSSSIQNPEVVWNEEMKRNMQECIDGYILSNKKTFVVEPNTSIPASAVHIERKEMAPVIYPSEVSALQCYQYYLGHLCNEEEFPDWPITNESAFLLALVDTLCQWVKPSKSSSALSAAEATLVLQSVAYLFKRNLTRYEEKSSVNSHFYASSDFFQFNGFSTLFQALEKAMNGESSETKTVFHIAVTCICLGCKLSQWNSQSCSTPQGVRILVASLKKLHEQSESSNSQVLRAIEMNLEALKLLMQEASGRAAISKHAEALPYTVYFIDQSLSNVTEAMTLNAIQIIEAILCKGGEALFEALLSEGVIWRILMLLFVSNSSIKVQAAHTLAEILKQGPVLKGNKALQTMQLCIKQCLTPEIASILVGDEDDDKTKQPSFAIKGALTLLNSEVMMPAMMWTASMKKELLELCVAQLSSSQYDDVLSSFMYKAQKEELTVGSIYLRFYNNAPRDAVLPDPVSFIQALMSSLAHDIAGVNQKPNALAAIVIRMEPVAESVRNLLAFERDTDVQVSKVDGVATIFSLLGKVFDSAPQLQLLALESLRILVYSDKCKDKVASIAPYYAVVLFRKVESIASSESTLAGKTARISLQFIGNLCLMAACIDKIVVGFDASVLSKLLAELIGKKAEYHHRNKSVVEAAAVVSDLNLLLTIYLIATKRHTSEIRKFCDQAVRSQLVQTLLGMLNSTTILLGGDNGNNNITECLVVRFLQSLADTNDSVRVSLNSSRKWENYRGKSLDNVVGREDDLRGMVVSPEAPALFD